MAMGAVLRSSKPINWSEHHLEDIVTIHDNKRIPLSEMERSKRKGPYPYCGANGVIDYINDFIFDGEYILLAEDGGDYNKFGNSCYIMNGKFWVNNHAHIICAIDKYSSNQYLSYLLNYLDLNFYIVGSTRKKMNQGRMRKILVLLPQIAEQKQIVDFLKTVDNTIQKSDELITKTEKLKNGLMQKLLINNGNTKSKIGEKISLEYGKGLPERERKEGQYPVYGSNGIVGYHSEFLVNGPGIIVGRKGTIGATVWADKNFWPIDTTYLVKLKDDKVNLKWLYYKLLSLNLSRLNMATGTPGLNRDLVYTQEINFPNLVEQQKIVEILSSVDKKLELERKRKEKLETIKKGLMNDLLTGKKRVKVSS